jgi:predicted amidohydrolase YtcJ
MHMAAGGRSLGLTDLSGMNRQHIREALTRAHPHDDTNTSWIEAFNWDENPSSRLDAAYLEACCPGRPLIVHKRDLHGCCCNISALRVAGILEIGCDTSSEYIGCDESGAPNGMLYEDAIGLVVGKKPAITDEERREFILRARDHLLRQGLTAVSEVLDSGYESIFRQLDEEGQLILDIDGWKRFENWDHISRPHRGDHFRVETIKIFLDGSFGSKTAAMLEPFSDGSGSGTLFYTDNELLEIARETTAYGWRLAIHAIGDRATQQVVRFLAKAPKPKSGYHRIEHMQQLPPGDFRELVETRAVVSFQPIHIFDDQIWLPDRIGADRCRRSFIWRSLAEAGIPLASGTDWPVAPVDPLLGLQASIHRARIGQQPHPAFLYTEALEPWQAIRAATHGYAIAANRTSERGAIQAGLSADLTVVSGVDESLTDWSSTKVRMTVCRGKIVHTEE